VDSFNPQLIPCLSPTVFYAKGLAMTIITDARSGNPDEEGGQGEVDEEKEDDDDSDERGSAPKKVTVSGVGSVELARKTYHLLRWLWAVENRIFRYSGTQDPPDERMTWKMKDMHFAVAQVQDISVVEQ
jgi:hypothetical protein